MKKDIEIDDYCATHTDCNMKCDECPAYHNGDGYSFDDEWDRFEDEEFMCGIY